jgi:phage-related protein
MPTADPGEKRMYANEVRRHKNKILALAEHIHEYSLHLLNDAQAGQPSMGESYAMTIASDIAEIRRRMAALDALTEVAFVFADAPEED